MFCDVKDVMRCFSMRCDFMRCDVMLYDVMRCFSIRCDFMRCDVMLYDVMRCDVDLTLLECWSESVPCVDIETGLDWEVRQC